MLNILGVDNSLQRVTTEFLKIKKYSSNRYVAFPNQQSINADKKSKEIKILKKISIVLLYSIYLLTLIKLSYFVIIDTFYSDPLVLPKTKDININLSTETKGFIKIGMSRSFRLSLSALFSIFWGLRFKVVS